MTYYGLDPAHYYTLPNFAWDAMLKMTKVSLDLVHDKEMYEMLEKGKRGGMCQVSHKHVLANNKYMTNYDEKAMSSYISYLDANNLYGLAMSMNLPYGNLKWCDNICNTSDVMNYVDGDVGYIVEVDLEYPKELHDLHSDYPLAPEVMCVTSDMVSDSSKAIYSTYHEGKEVGDEKSGKLILNLCNKKNMYYTLEILNIT
jgi:hypothetical protein